MADEQTDDRVYRSAGGVSARRDRADEFALERLLVEAPLSGHDRG